MDSDSGESTLGGLIDLSEVSKFSLESAYLFSTSGKKAAGYPISDRTAEENVSCVSPKGKITSSHFAAENPGSSDFVAPVQLHPYSPEDQPLISFETSTPDSHLISTDMSNFLTCETFPDANLCLSDSDEESEQSGSRQAEESSEPKPAGQHLEEPSQQTTIQDILLQLRYGGRAHFMTNDLERISEAEELDGCTSERVTCPLENGNSGSVSMQGDDIVCNEGTADKTFDKPSCEMIAPECDEVLIDFESEVSQPAELNTTVSLDKNSDLCSEKYTFCVSDDPSSPGATNSGSSTHGDSQLSLTISHPSRLPTLSRSRPHDAVDTVTIQLTDYALMREAWMEREEAGPRHSSPGGAGTTDRQTLALGVPMRVASDSTSTSTSVSSSASTYILGEEEEDLERSCTSSHSDSKSGVGHLNTTQTLAQEEDCRGVVAAACAVTKPSAAPTGPVETEARKSELSEPVQRRPSKATGLLTASKTAAGAFKGHSLGASAANRKQASTAAQKIPTSKPNAKPSQGVCPPGRQSMLKDSSCVRARKPFSGSRPSSSNAPRTALPSAKPSSIPPGRLQDHHPEEPSKPSSSSSTPGPCGATKSSKPYQSTPNESSGGVPPSIVLPSGSTTLSSIEGSDHKVQVDSDFSDRSVLLSGQSGSPQSKRHRRSGIPLAGKPQASKMMERPRPVDKRQRSAAVCCSPTDTSPKLPRPRPIPRAVHVRRSLVPPTKPLASTRVPLQERNGGGGSGGGRARTKTTTVSTLPVPSAPSAAVKGTPLQPLKPVIAKPVMARDSKVAAVKRLGPTAKGRVAAGRENVQL